MKKYTIASSLASLIASATAQGAIQVGTPISVSGNQSATWSVDGTTGDFFLLVKTQSFQNSASDFAYTASAKFVGVNGGEFAATAFDNMAYITGGMVVNSLFNFNNGSAFKNTYDTPGITGAASAFLSNIPNGATRQFGFKFTRGADTHYGIADFHYEIIGGPTTASITLSNVLWNDTPGQGITGAGTAAVPEPEVAALGLAGLALGAAGLRRWRKGRQAA